LIEVSEIDVFYGDIQALWKVSLSVSKAEIVALIGANGAGKSTLIKAIAGLLPKRNGMVQFDGRPVTGLDSTSIARLGMAIVPEGRRLFVPLSVLDNLRLGAYLRLRDGQEKEVREDLERIFTLFPPLRERIRLSAGTLSGGEQQMLAIARTLMAAPKVMLMDEPSIGLAPLVVRDIFRVIKQLKVEGNTILLVEQNARMAFKVADRAYVMEVGRITLDGKVEDLVRTGSVEKLYLGA
jgi:branched-chain amino acid transport system ATP-binding protein